MNKTHWKKLQNPNYLGSFALDPGQEPVLTIAKVSNEMVTGDGGRKEECTVAHFLEKDVLPMILNSTNMKTIEKILGTPYIEEWAKRRIQVYHDPNVMFAGKKVGGLRIRPKEPASPNQTKPELVPSQEKWSGAVRSMQEGAIDIPGIRKHYTLSPENEALLLQQSKVEKETQTCQEQDT